MLISRQNLGGGRRITHFPLEEENGYLGFKVGYCSHCNEPILLRTIDTQEIMAYFKISEEKYKQVQKLLKPKVSVKEMWINWLIKRLESKKTVEI